MQDPLARHSSDLFEREIAEALWKWPSPSADTRSGNKEFNSHPNRQLMQSLEFYWADILARLPSKSPKMWWCDGFIEIALKAISSTAFRLDGVMWLGKQADQFPAPFELEFHFAGRLDLKTTRVIARVGDLDRQGQIRHHKTPTQAQQFLMNRPHSDRDWAIAIDVRPGH